MGLMPSPYYSVKDTYLAEEVVWGNIQDPRNPFHWAQVHLNLPGSPEYQPHLPWVRRLTALDDLAGGSERYVDDVRTIGRSAEH
jgi:hypothetical protein